jgi:Na+/H+ antiporter NhaD/arsenite permease-like protein
MRAKLKMIKEEMWRRMQRPIPPQGNWLHYAVNGYFKYQAVLTNARAPQASRRYITDLWRRRLPRRSRKDRMTRTNQLVDDWLPKPIILQSLAKRTLCRCHTPEVGAVCGKPPLRFSAGERSAPTASRDLPLAHRARLHDQTTSLAYSVAENNARGPRRRTFKSLLWYFADSWTLPHIRGPPHRTPSARGFAFDRRSRHSIRAVMCRDGSLERPIGLTKSASALLAAGLLWTVYALLTDDQERVGHELAESVTVTARIVFFLFGAMTIVEVIDAHDGFNVVTSRIRPGGLAGLLWLISSVTFVLSAILDNLTTTIVMVSLIRKLLDRVTDRLLFASIVVIAANAGGAWSPMGNITTTMLWIGGQVTALGIISAVFLASVVNMLVPLSIASRQLAGRSFTPIAPVSFSTVPPFERYLMFWLGLGVLILVPAFSEWTHLSPFLGILFGLGIVWMAGELVHKLKGPAERERKTVAHAFGRIDLSWIVFFLGVLFAVAALEHSKILAGLADWLDRAVGRQDVIVILLGLLSAIVDNVPLVATSMGMYSISRFPADSFLWEFIAYCAGTGGSILIIGSAAGVAAMGIENIRFGWYLRRVSWLALLGYFAGAAVYVTQHHLLH